MPELSLPGLAKNISASAPHTSPAIKIYLILSLCINRRPLLQYYYIRHISGIFKLNPFNLNTMDDHKIK